MDVKCFFQSGGVLPKLSFYLWVADLELINIPIVNGLYCWFEDGVEDVVCLLHLRLHFSQIFGQIRRIVIEYFSCFTGPIVDFIFVIERERLKVNQALKPPSIILDIHFAIDLTQLFTRSKVAWSYYEVFYGESSYEWGFNCLIIPNFFVNDFIEPIHD